MIKKTITTESNNDATAQETANCVSKSCSYNKIILAIIIVICGGCMIWQNINLSTRLDNLEQNMATNNKDQHVEEYVARLADFENRMTTFENKLVQNAEDNLKVVDENRKIYVFNMDETVKNIGLQEANQKFEDDINDLDAQVKEAQATLKDLKEKDMREKLLNLTIKPLQMKRDDLVQAYSKSVQDSLAQINNALAEIATENNISVIFMNKSVAVNTNYVIDVTPQIVEKIKAKQQQ